MKLDNRHHDNFMLICEFIIGQRDCRLGLEHQNKNEHYNRGYAAQHELEQIQTHQSEKQSED